jgi:hypothetical protein
MEILDALFISQNDVFFSLGAEGGPFSPTCKSYTLTNEGISTVNWTAEGTQSWLDVTPGSGTLAPGSFVVVEMCINSIADTLAEGRYTDTVSFTNTNSGFSHFIDVALYVGDEIYVPLQFPTIQSAINASYNGDTIIVLDGTYTGDGNRDIDFDGRAITLKSENGPESCIIHCEGTEQYPRRGFYFHSGEYSQSVVEGFTITGGWQCGPGAGIYCSNSSPTIKNCIITGNQAFFSESDYGGGIYCDNSSPIISNCVISANRGGDRGGGIYCCNNSCPVITNCIIRDNVSFYPMLSGRGGGMYNDHSNPILTNCTFSGNRSIGGAGMTNAYSDPVLTNCTFSQNSGIGDTDYSGGGMYNINSNPTLINCLFYMNSMVGGGYPCYGGGMYNSNSKPTLTNCIFWGNRDSGGIDESAQIHTAGVGGPVINYSCIQGLDTFSGHGNIGEDPCFADPYNGEYHLKSEAGRWDANNKIWVQDDVTSPCIDTGDPNSDWTKELWPHGKRINMGAYGGTPQASMSLSDIGNIANLDNDVNDIVDSLDLALFVEKWCYEEFLLAEDLNRDGFVDFDDFAIFGQQYSHPPASEPGITYQIEKCDPSSYRSPATEPATETRFSVIVEGSYIHFKDMMVANCCTDKLGLEMTVEDNLITIYEIEYIPGVCFCICDYPVTAALGPFEPGTYALEVYETTGGLIGSTIVTIDQGE